MFRRARLAGLTSRNGYDWLREKSQCTLSVCRLRNKKHMDNTTQGSPGHLTLTSRESGASIQSFLDESFHFVAASLGDIVGSPTSADLSLDVAHAEICLVVTLQCLWRRGGTWGRSSNCPRRTVVPQCEGRRGDRAQEPRTSRHVSAGRPGHGDRRTGAGGRHSGSSGHLNIRSVSCLADWQGCSPVPQTGLSTGGQWWGQSSLLAITTTTTTRARETADSIMSQHSNIFTYFPLVRARAGGVESTETNSPNLIMPCHHHFKYVLAVLRVTPLKRFTNRICGNNLLCSLVMLFEKFFYEKSFYPSFIYKPSFIHSSKYLNF